MSWHMAFFSNSDPNKLSDDFAAALEANASAFANDVEREQANACLDAIHHLIANDVLGDVDVIHVEASGHANEDHEGQPASRVRIEIIRQSGMAVAEPDAG